LGGTSGDSTVNTDPTTDAAKSASHDDAREKAAVADGAARNAETGGRSELAVKPTTVQPESVKGQTILRGRILTSESNQPVAGAKLYIEPHFGAFRLILNDGSETKPTPKAVTGADGRFEIRDVEPGRNWDLRVEAPARRQVKSNLTRMTRGEEREMGDIAMDQGAAVEGRVTDAAGSPISGAFVNARPAPKEGPGVVFSMSSVGPQEFEAVTDASGRYKLDGLPAEEPYIVLGSAEARVSSKSQPFTPRLGTPTLAPDLVLRDGKEITGKVVKRDGTAVAQAIVSTRASMRGMIFDPMMEGRRNKPILTDAEGRFRVAGLDDRNVELVVRAEGVGSARKRNVVPGTRDLVVELEPQGTIRGKLVAAPGVDKAQFADAFATFDVYAERVNEGARNFGYVDQESEGRSLDGGAFELTGLAKGKYRVHVEGEGFAAAVSDVVDIVPGRTVDNLEIAVSPGRTLEVKVTKAGSEDPIEGARVRVKEVREADNEFGMVMSGSEDDEFDDGAGGRFGGGEFGVAVRARTVSASPAVGSSGSSRPGPSRRERPFQPMGGDGKPAPYIKTLETNSKGVARFTGLPDARFDLRARKLDMAPSETKNFSFEQATTLTGPASENLEMSDGGGIEGFVTRGGDAPASGVTVELVGPEPGTARRTAMTDVKGAYKFEHLTPGAYHAQVEKRQSGPMMIENVNGGAPAGTPVAVVEAKVAKLDLTAPILVTVLGSVTQAGAPVAGVRAVPGSVVRYSAFIENGAVLMPSFVNVGARVGAGTMIDTWATVGSCAQVGKNCHVAGGVGIGGVLEPPSATPVIIEDNCFLGSRCIVVEGSIIEEGAVLGANVVITASTQIIDVTQTKEVIHKGRVPANSVVIPGTRPKEFTAGTFDVPCALIIGKRSASTDRKTSLNAALRDFGIAS